jgi:hypothetical protein
MFRAIAFAFTLLAVAAPAAAEVRTVRAGDDLQEAINAARPGDELRLAPDATFSGNFELPATTGSSVITIRTDLPDASLPAPNQRVTPATASRFAKIVSPNSAAALRTAPGAHHWRVMFVEFPPTKEGFGDIIQLGDGSSAQSDLSQVPHDLTFDRVYIHGDPVFGQKRGIALNARAVTIRNSYISDIKAVGADAQAIAGWNGPGQYSIENNYLEAAAEGVLFGGSDPPIRNLVTADILVRYNHITRPMSWRDPILPSPSSVTATGVEGGSLPPGVYAYSVAARRGSGQGTTAISAASGEATAVPTAGAVRVAWAAVDGVTEYQVFARNPAGVTQSWTVTGTSYTDTGAPGKAGSRPGPDNATRWQVKNLFELKNARRVQVEYNLLENNWLAAQPGYAVVLTPRNQDGHCTWCVVEQVSFSHNVVRNTAAGFNISGYDTNGVTLQTNTLTIQDNLVYQTTTALGGSGWMVLIGDGPRDVVFDHNTFDFDGTTLLYAYGGTKAEPKVISGFRFTNNVAPHQQYGINGADASTGTLTFQMYFPDPVVTGNWLSGGPSSKYPAGNRFDGTFTLRLTAAATSDAQGAGANLSKLLPLFDAVPKGLMIGIPMAPTNLRIISSGG